jgi:hypothetical protein
MHDKVIKPTHVLEEDHIVKHSGTRTVAVRLLCTRFLSIINVNQQFSRLLQMRHLYPIDVVTVSGTISKIHQLLDEHSTDIQSFLKKRERLNNRLSNNFSINTQHDHDCTKEGSDRD